MPHISESDDQHRERRAREKAIEDTMQNFLQGSLKNGEGVEIDSRKEAMTMADAAGRSAIQNLKKGGTQFSVFASGS